MLPNNVRNIKNIKLTGSIKGKLVLYFMLLVMVPFFFLGLMAYRSEEAALRERTRAQLTSIADIQKNRIRDWIFERISDARFLENNPWLPADLEMLSRIGAPSRYKKSVEYRKVADLLDSVKANHGYLDVVIMDDKGRVMASTEEGELGESLSGEDYFRGALKTPIGLTYIQDIYNDQRLGKKLAMAFSGPIQSPSSPGKIIGVAAIVVGMDESFYPIFAGWPGMGRTGDVLIVRKEGDYIVFLSHTRFLTYTPLELRFTLDKSPKQALYAASGREGIIEAADYRGVKALATYRYIPETKWGLVVKEDSDQAFAPVTQLERRVALGMAGTLVLVFILVYLASTRIARPVISLSKLTRRIAEGDFSVSVPVMPVKKMDEVGSLAVAFNEMAAALARYKQEVEEKGRDLEKANRELSSLAQSLEEKVSARTQELEELNRALISMMQDLDERTGALEASQDELKKFAAELEESRNRVRENLEIVEQANIELRRIDRMKDHFLGMVSHELRTPLSLITGYSSNLLSDSSMKLEPRMEEALDGIQKGAERLRNIITEMLDVSQIDAKGLRLSFVSTNIGKLIEEVLKELGSFIRERKHKVVVGDYHNVPDILLDKKRMHQVFVNIIGNAIKFTPDGGRIEIAFKGYGDDCKEVQDIGKDFTGFLDVTVKDSGIGLDREELDRIFEKFYEVGEIDKHATSKFGFLGRGVGLGLAIARGIVEAHGGRLWGESPGYDPLACPGSSFHISLPVGEKTKAGVSPEVPDAKAEAARPGVSAGAVPAQMDGQGMVRCKVLVIEDDPDILDLTRRVLDEDYSILAADNGRGGIDIAREKRPDLILLDVYMEGMDGFEVLDVLKKDERTKDIPVALFTAGAQRWEMEMGYRAGADDFITKPFRADDLLAKVRSLVHAKNKVD